MKTCPNCSEILGDSIQICIKCKYNFKYKKVTSQEEQRQLEKTEHELKAIRQKEASIQISKNPMYEYKVIVVNNLSDGQIDQERIQAELNTWAEAGWKLWSVFNNEIGKTSSSVSIGFIGSTVNATIDQTVIIFERCIKAESN